jgi:uroporphyrin-III C-methyltransferase/precorrin-2 dehydrogenase/sirohydrochlorin ferrochelatase
MDFLPVFARLDARPCLLVGGGAVAERKARLLLRAGARLTVNAPRCSEAMQQLLHAQPALRHIATPFDSALLADHHLVIAATDDPEVNRVVARVAHAAGRWCNVVDDGAHSSFILPAIIDRSPLIVAVSTGGQAPMLARLLRQRLEQLLPAGLGRLARWAGPWRERVGAELGDGATRRRFWERLLTGPAAARLLAGDVAAAERLAAELLEGVGEMAPGRAWLVGAGPGDPELISVRGLRALEQADVILHDRLVAPALLEAARREAEIICVGKTGGGSSVNQAEINRLLVERVRAGQRVCRLKGGDPFIFGRGAEEAAALAAAGLPFEIVPGITAANGCAAAAGIPLTQREVAHAVTLATASSAPGAMEPDWAALAHGTGTLVLYMGGRRLEEIATQLQAHGRAGTTPAALIVAGTTAAQQVLRGTLADIPAQARVLDTLSPALLIVGETVNLSAGLPAEPQAWSELSLGALSRAI